jgi:hypothetical protein
MGILLLYLFDTGAQAAEQPGGRAPLAVGEPIELGDFLSHAGKIPIRPLDEWDVAPPLARRGAPLDGPGDLGGGGAGGVTELGSAPRLPRQPAELPESALEPRAARHDAGFSFGGAAGGGAGAGGISPQTETPTEPLEPTSYEFPQIVLVVVRSDGAQSSRSLEGRAISDGRWRQVGLEDCIVDMGNTTSRVLQLRSERLLPMLASSDLDAADLALITEHVGLLNSTVLGGAQADYVVLGTRDLMRLAASSGTTTTTNVNSSSTAIEASRIILDGASDQVGLESVIKLMFTGIGNSQNAELSFNLLAQAMKESQVLMGSGNDTLAISSGFFDGIGSLFDPSYSPGGFVFQLNSGDAPSLEPLRLDFSMNATAIGLNNSLIDAGPGNDSISILTRIDSNLPVDLQPVSNEESRIAINLQRIGLLNSTVSMGDGNDTLRVSGQVINSTIDMGSGRNLLILDQGVDANSRVILGDGGSFVTSQGALGGLLQGGSGDDRFNLADTVLGGEIDGGSGNNTLSSSGSVLGARDLLVVNRADAGTLGGVRFRNMQNIELGDGDDLMIMDLDGTLTGRVLGGNGLDRLEFSEWDLPVNVDLDLGRASGINAGNSGGISGFEQVVGGRSSDRLSSSCISAGLNGGPGDDVLFLRWNPWQSPFPQGIQLVGAQGRDLFVFSGLEEEIPADWDGISGLPRLMDLDLIGAEPVAPGQVQGIGLSDQIAWLRKEVLPNGVTSQSLQRLTPSGLGGLGDVRQLPIAPLERLLAGMADGTRQLAIAVDPAGGGTLELLGSNGRGTSMSVARIESNMLGTAGPTSIRQGSAADSLPL